jgi:hypothetical protein
MVLGVVGLIFANSGTAVSKTTGFISELQPTIIGKPLKLNMINPPQISQDWPIDTLKNDNDTAYWYFNPPSYYFLSRLSPAAPCTLQYLMFAKQANDSNDATVAGCSLGIWKDTMIGGGHRPGRKLAFGYATDSCPQYWWGAIFSYDVRDDSVRMGAEDFWVGYRWVMLTADDTLFPLGDFVASEPDRNAYGLVSNGPFAVTAISDFINRAVVKYEDVDVHDITVLSIGNSQGFFLPNPGNATITGVFTNNGNVTENNVPVVCSVYTEAGAHVTNFSQNIASIAVGVTDTVAFTPNWAPNTDGVYYLSVRARNAGDMRPQDNQMLREAQVCSSPAELRYDDGSLENAWAYYQKGNGWANKFTPPYYPAKITMAKVFTWDATWPVPGGNTAIIKVIDDDGLGGFPGTVLFVDTVTTVNRGNWTDVAVDPNVQIDAGSFYVVYIQADTSINSPALAIDNDAPASGENYTLVRDTWYYDPVTPGGYNGADWGIRAVISNVGTIDAELYRITMPDRALMDTLPFTPKVEVKNNSTFPIDIPTSFTIKEGLVTVYTGNETAYAALPNGVAVPLTFDLFPVVGLDSNKTYSMEARTSLLGDPTPANDVKTGTFTIEAGGGPPPTGPWEPMATILPEPSGKNPKSGSCLAGLNGAIYFLKAGGKPDFAKYTPNSTTGTWAVAETLKKGDKLLGDGKYPKKGASMAAYGKDIFVLRGNNTPGFWKYHTDTIAGETLGWKKMVNIPTGAKNPKDASGMTAITRTTLAGDSDYIFTMKGSKTSEFYFYDLTTNLWSAALTAPPTGTSTKAGYKKGSCLAYDEATKNVYVLKGQYGDFFKFNVDSLTWTELKRYDHKTMLNFDGKKKKFGDGAAMVYQDGAVYVLKGGSTYDVWKYNVVGDSQNWTQMGPAADWNIPAGGGKKVKAGGGMTLLAGNFYAVKGANTAEFYRHGPPAFAIAIPSLPTENEGAMGNTMAKGEFKLVLAPNPAINMTAVRYSLPKAGPVRFTLYNVAGSVVRTYANTNSTNNGVLMVDTKALPSGVYILRFTSDELTVTRKLVLQK